MNYSRVFIDTNIIIDILAQREPFFSSSKALLTLPHVSFVISSMSIVNAYYICKPRNKKDYQKFISFFEIEELTQEIINHAFKLPINDIEDSIQLVSALSSGADAFITRDIKLKNFLDVINVYTPLEFIKVIKFL